jgi:glutamate synthase domain-containing protein 3
VGNHACEYMTGGVVAVLGRTGRNFGAGMSNGVAYVFDEAGTFPSRVNHDLVQLAALDGDDERLVHALLELHRHRTGSPRARALLDGWGRQRRQWRKVQPRGAAEHVVAIRAQWFARVGALLESPAAGVSVAPPEA